MLAANAQPLAAAARTVSFSIPAGPLSAAMVSFSRQAGLQVSYMPDTASGVQTSGVMGTLTVADALTRLLAGTGLSYSFANASSVTISRPSRRAADAPAGSIALDTIYVQGDANGTFGFVATRSSTGTKTDTPLIETPQSISVVTRDQMDVQAVCNAVGVRTFRQRLIAAPAVGDALLGLADLAVRHAALLKSVPTGAVTSLIGAPLLLLMIRRLPASLPRAGSVPQVSQFRSRPIAIAVILVGAFALSSMVGRDAGGWRFDALSEALHLWPWRGPRLLAVFGSGAMLGCAGALMQRLTGNPMASPEMLGISSGAAIVVMLAMMFFPRLDAGWVALLAFVGAFVALATLVTISLRAGFASERLLLTGMAIGSTSTALCAVVLASGDPGSMLLLSWMAGSTYRITHANAYFVVAVAALVSLASLPLARPLEILELGEPGARALGVALTPIRLLIVVLAAAAAATATLSVGPLSFVGLAGPHIARLFGFRRTAGHLLASATIGGCVMMIADWIGRTALFPWEILRSAGQISSRTPRNGTPSDCRVQ